MRCDLHVHSLHSGPADLPVLRHLGRECYSEPEAVYERALGRGMDLVTLTDHDSIEGALRIAHLPDTFVSEEVTLDLPGGRQLHLGVFDITEKQHEAIQRRRRDPEALFAHLYATRAGDGWLWLAVGLALAAGGRDGHRVLAAAAASAGVANILQVLLKRRVRRPRPCDLAPRRQYDVKPLGHFPSDRYSFPSGHALNAFAIGSVLALAFPLLAGPVLIVAASVAASRVVLGLHFLSDVLVGSLLGTLIGAGAYALFLG